VLPYVQVFTVGDSEYRGVATGCISPGHRIVLTTLYNDSQGLVAFEDASCS
jgi:hypothetical protein